MLKIYEEKRKFESNNIIHLSYNISYMLYFKHCGKVLGYLRTILGNEVKTVTVAKVQ